MKCLTNRECLEWLDAHAIDAVTAEGWPEIVGDYEVLFAAPTNARAQALLARDLLAWVGEFETALFWLTDWPFYKPDEMAIISGLRRTNGEQRRLIDAAGHLFEVSERDELIGWVSLVMSYGWDGYLFTLPFDCQGCCDQYRARYRRRGPRCRVFALCVLIFAHKMKLPTPNPAAGLDGGSPALLTNLAHWPDASEPCC